MKGTFFIILLIASIVCSVAYAGQEDFVYDSKGNRDPFVPLVTKEGIYVGNWQATDLAEIVLEGIVWDPKGESMAIVNGTVVKEGDELLNLKILEVKREGIRVLKGDKELIINLTNNEEGKE
jgi:hypothetical protein